MTLKIRHLQGLTQHGTFLWNMSCKIRPEIRILRARNTRNTIQEYCNATRKRRQKRGDFFPGPVVVRCAAWQSPWSQRRRPPRARWVQQQLERPDRRARGVWPASRTGGWRGTRAPETWGGWPPSKQGETGYMKNGIVDSESEKNIASEGILGVWKMEKCEIYESGE